MTYITACKNGSFGDGCNETCGECLGDGICHFQTGECETGCNKGYQGLQCKDSKYMDQQGGFGCFLTYHKYSFIILLSITFFLTHHTQTFRALNLVGKFFHIHLAQKFPAMNMSVTLS